MNRTPLHLTKSEMFHTPESMQEVENWINLHPADNRIALLTVMGMTWNFAASIVEAHNKFGGDAVSDGSLPDLDEAPFPELKQYHTLLTAELDEDWEAHFGDYDYATVLAETDELECDVLWMIITTDHAQQAIQNEIDRINANHKRE
jgi:hypothetical protein